MNSDVMHKAVNFGDPVEELNSIEHCLETSRHRGIPPDPNVLQKIASVANNCTTCNPPSPQIFCDFAAGNLPQCPNTTGNYIYSPPIPNSFYGSALSHQDFEKLAVYEGQKIIELNSKIAYDHELYKKKRDFELMKAEIHLRQAKVLEELKSKRELMSESVTEKEGYLVIARTLPDGPTNYSKPLLSVADMKLKILIAEGRDSEVELLEWRNCQKALRLTSNCNATLFSKELGRAGIGIFINKNYKLSSMELVYAYLRAHAEIVAVCPCFGWNLSTDNRWHFADEREVVFDDYE